MNADELHEMSNTGTEREIADMASGRHTPGPTDTAKATGGAP